MLPIGQINALRDAEKLQLELSSQDILQDELQADARKNYCPKL